MGMSYSFHHVSDDGTNMIADKSNQELDLEIIKENYDSDELNNNKVYPENRHNDDQQ